MGPRIIIRGTTSIREALVRVRDVVDLTGDSILVVVSVFVAVVVIPAGQLVNHVIDVGLYFLFEHFNVITDEILEDVAHGL